MIKLSDLSAEGILALRKCDAAERFTSVPGKVRPEVYLTFQECGLVEWRGGQRLTEDGRRLLVAWTTRADKRHRSVRR
jgi:ribosomal protein S19E (S16A)